jgi:hypothetical protein
MCEAIFCFVCLFVHGRLSNISAIWRLSTLLVAWLQSVKNPRIYSVESTLQLGLDVDYMFTIHQCVLAGIPAEGL